MLETDLIDLINNGVVCSLQRDDIPQVEQDVVFLAQDWQAAVSDIQLVAEMEWFIVGYVTDFLLEICLHTSKRHKTFFVKSTYYI